MAEPRRRPTSVPTRGGTLEPSRTPSEPSKRTTKIIIPIVVAIIPTVITGIFLLLSNRNNQELKATINIIQETAEGELKQLQDEYTKDYEAAISSIEASASQEISQIKTQHAIDLAKVKIDEHSKGYNEGYKANKSEIEASAELRYIEEYSKGYAEGYNNGLDDGKKSSSITESIANDKELSTPVYLDTLETLSTTSRSAYSWIWNKNENQIDKDNIGDLYDHGLGLYFKDLPSSANHWIKLEYYTNKKYSIFKGKLIIHYQVKDIAGTFQLKILKDDSLIYTSPLMRTGVLPVDIDDIDILGATKVTFHIYGVEDSYGDYLLGLVDAAFYK